MARPGSIRSFRVAGRLTNAFTLELVKIGGHRRDVIDALIRAALLNANVAHISRDPDLQRRFAAFETDIPDEMRRPASIHAIAESLRIPYETARRRIGRMAEQGACLIGENGVIVRSAVTSSPMFRQGCQLQYEQLRDLYFRLRTAGVLEPPETEHAPFEGPSPPLRLVGRLVVEYVLRFTEPVRRHIGDVITGLVLMDMIQANTAHLPDTEAGTEVELAGGFVPDARRTPVSASALAKRLGVPGETVRRHVIELLERDLCRKQPRGYVVPAEVLARPLFVQFVGDNYANLTRLFAGLGEYGVVATWERELRERAA